MNIKNHAIRAKEKISDTLEGRLDRLENFIADRGIGSSQLEQAKKVQRNVNIAAAAGGALIIAGITFWALTAGSGDDEDYLSGSSWECC